MRMEDIVFGVRPSFGAPYNLRLTRGVRPESQETVYRLTCRSSYAETERTWQAESSDGEFVWNTLAEADVTLAPDTIIGLDGVDYDLTIRSGFNEVRLEWWLRLPEQWKAIEPAVERLKKMVSDSYEALGLQIEDILWLKDDPHA